MNFLPPPQLSPSLLWDVSIDAIDWQANRRWVIERVVSEGTWSDWQELVRYYTLATIKQEVLQLPSLPPKPLAFLAIVFNLPLGEFRCYTLKSSRKRHWIY